MKVNLEDIRRQYADLSDEGLLEIDREDLVDLARQCYDAELASRQLKAATLAPVSAQRSEPDGETEELAVLETYTFHDEANMACELLRGAGIAAGLGHLGLELLVPRSDLAVARQFLAARLSDEELADAATADTSYIRHGFGAVRPYLYGKFDLVEFVEQVFGAVELERSAFGGNAFHIEMRIADSVVVMEVSDPPYSTAAPASVYVYVEDVDAAYERAIEAGAVSVAAPEDKPYAERSAGVKDSFGNTWWISTYRGT
jgi:PhnB protein